MKILQYYRKSLISISSIFLPIIILALIFGKFNMSSESIIELIYLILGMSVFIGTLYFAYDKYFGPKERLKQIEKYPFTEFIKIGFKSENDYLIGKIKKYTVVIGYNWRNDDGLQVVYGMILFDPRVNGKHINDYDLYKFQQSIKDNYNFWDYGRLTTEFPFQMKKPKFEKIVSKLEKNASLIEKRGLQKIEFTKWKNEIENYIDKKNN